MKRIFALAMTLCILLSLSLPAMASATQAEEITLRFAWWGDASRHDVYNKICDTFESMNPGVTIEREPNTFNAYFEKLATQVASGNAPDVFGMHARFATEFASRNVMEELQPYVDQGIISLTDLDQPVIDSGKINDTLYMICQGVTLNEFLLNEDMCKRLEVEVPDVLEDWTWEEFVATCYDFREKALAAGEDVYFIDEPYQYNFFRIYLLSYGEELFNNDGTIGCTKERITQWFSMWQNMRNDDVIPDAASVTENVNATLETQMFTLGKCAVTNIPVNKLNQYQAQMTDNLRPLRSPLGNDGTRGVYIEGAHNCISSAIDDEHKLVAAKFLDFFTNSEECLKDLLIQQGTPANTQMSEYVLQFMDEAQIEAMEYVKYTQPLASIGNMLPVGYSEMNTLYLGIREASDFAAMTPEEAAQAYLDGIQEILDKNSK